VGDSTLSKKEIEDLLGSAEEFKKIGKNKPRSLPGKMKRALSRMDNEFKGKRLYYEDGEYYVCCKDVPGLYCKVDSLRRIYGTN